MDIDPLLHSLGGLRGRYQQFQLTLQILSSFVNAFIYFSVVFIGFEPDYECAQIHDPSQLESHFSGNLSEATFEATYDKCSIDVQLNRSGLVTSKSLPCVAGINFSMPSDTSFRTEWELVCDKAGLTELSQTLLSAGQALGALFLSGLSDRYGRKVVYVVSDISLLFLSIATALSPNIIFLVVLRVVTGAWQQGVGMAAYTMFMELLPKRMHPLASLADAIFWSSGQVLMALIAYLMQGYTWRYLQLALSAVFLYSLALPCVLDESILWLLNNDRVADVEKILAKACRLNGKNLDDVIAVLHEQVLKSRPTSREKDVVGENIHGGLDSEESPMCTNMNGPVGDTIEKTTVAEVKAWKKYKPVDLFRHREVVVPLFVCIVVWTANNLFYYGVMLGSASLAGNRFLNFALLTLLEIPANTVAFFLLQKINRRTMALTCEMIAGISLLLSVVFVQIGGSGVYLTMGTVVTYVGKFALSGCYNTLFVFCLEVFPTTLRSVGMGVASTVSRLPGMAAPFFILLGETIPWAPGVIFGGMCVLAGLSVLLLPETRHRALPNTIEEIREWKNRPPMKRCLMKETGGMDEHISA
ncbi:hypothetical protein BaRGS_00012787 [Batillaria attramentaria]|uniref:Major facilitator superfamily (MFS) profile domain-containing protein n=1 Tax=Batillaria attramentaria TaxID=370345 RepID=A0ABD0L9W1_9CAEN